MILFSRAANLILLKREGAGGGERRPQSKTVFTHPSLIVALFFYLFTLSLVSLLNTFVSYFVGKHHLKPQGKNHDQLSHLHPKCSPSLR